MNNIVLSRIERDSIRVTRDRISEVISEIKTELANHEIEVKVKGYESTRADEKAYWHYTFESSLYFVDIEIKDFKSMTDSIDGRIQARFEVAMEDGLTSLDDKDFSAVQFNEHYSVIDFIKSNITRRFKFIHDKRGN